MGAIASLAMVGVGFWAYQNGYLAPLISDFNAVYGNDTGIKTTIKSVDKAPLPPTGAVVEPTLPNAGKSKYEQIIWNNEFDVSNWAWQRKKLVAAMIWQESGGNVKALGPVISSGVNKGDRAHGLLQVMPITARDMYDRLGKTKYPATSATLLTEVGGIYYGTEYLDYLSTRAPNKSDWRWVVRAYYGGEGHAVNAAKNPKLKAMHDKYLSEIETKYMKIHQGKV